MGRVTTVPLRSRPRTKIVPVAVPELAFVEVSVDTSMSISFEVAEDGISETDGVR